MDNITYVIERLRKLDNKELAMVKDYIVRIKTGEASADAEEDFREIIVEKKKIP